MSKIPNFCAVIVDDEPDIRWCGEGSTPDEAVADLMDNDDFENFCEYMGYDKPEKIDIKIYTCIDVKDSDWPEDEVNPNWAWCLDQKVETRTATAIVTRITSENKLGSIA